MIQFKNKTKIKTNLLNGLIMFDFMMSNCILLFIVKQVIQIKLICLTYKLKNKNILSSCITCLNRYLKEKSFCNQNKNILFSICLISYDSYQKQIVSRLLLNLVYIQRHTTRQDKLWLCKKIYKKTMKTESAVLQYYFF